MVGARIDTGSPGRRASRGSIAIAALALLADDRPAMAGMPAITLSDIARMRIQTISFFLVVFLLSACVIQRIWNSLRRDFTRLPHLSYRRALGVVSLWGLLFLLVLTMISGARELMTPGAWKKDGLTYKLAESASAPPTPSRDDSRRANLERLAAALHDYARTHDGKYPSGTDSKDFPESLWRLDDPSGLRYLYEPGASRDDAPLAYEPDLGDGGRLVLLRNGEIRRMDAAQFERALNREAR